MTISVLKNIQIIDGAQNDANFVYQVTADEVDFIFPADTDIAFGSPVRARQLEI